MAKRIIIDSAKHAWVMISESIGSFRRNDDLKSASSMAFSSMLALIPALFLLTSLFGAAIGSSQKALLKTQELVEQVIPRFSEVILKEVGHIASHRKALGIVNFLLLMWSITPLVASMRNAFGTIFKASPSRNFLIAKLIDVLIVILLLTGGLAVAVAGFVLKYLRKIGGVTIIPHSLEIAAPFVFIVLIILFLYYAFTPKVRFRHLLAGAVVTAVLWTVMRPAFDLFLTYNPGYGLTFGSFKSVFIIIIWIYYSQVVFLFGAEVTSALDRKESILIKRLMEGGRVVPSAGRSRFVVPYERGQTVFSDGDAGGEMYYVLLGSVSIRKDGRELAVIPQGKYFGEMSFLLAEPRTAAAIANEDTELIVINDRNIDALTREFPGYIREMLTEMARRLKETNRLLQ